MSAKSHVQLIPAPVRPQQQLSGPSTALCVNVPTGWRDALAQLFEVMDADTASEALRALRGMAIDLLVVGAEVGGEPFWSFVARVRRARPKLAWILVGDVSDSDEVRARCLGVLMVLGPDIAVGNGSGGGGGDLLSRARIGLMGDATTSDALPVDIG
jgi:hypothetical protein